MLYLADVGIGSSSEVSSQSGVVIDVRHCTRCQCIMGSDWKWGACSECQGGGGEEAKNNPRDVLAVQTSGATGSGRHRMGNMPHLVRCLYCFQIPFPLVFVVQLLIFACGTLSGSMHILYIRFGVPL
jgi:hypothetical protein